MLFLRKNLKNLSDFSLSEKRPLFWLLLTPFLFLLSLLIALPCSSRVGFILPFLSFIGFLAILRFKLKGLFLSLSGFVLYFSFDFFFHTDPFFLWRSFWGLSLFATLVLSLVSFEEVATYYREKKEGLDKELSQLKHLLYESEERETSYLRLIEKEKEERLLKMQEVKMQLEALTLLTEASQNEAAKVFKQNETLSLESLSFHRQIATLEGKMAKQKEEHQKLEFLYEEASQSAKERLCKLNEAQVNLFQHRKLFDIFQDRLKKARSAFLRSRHKEAVEKKSSLPPTLPSPPSVQGMKEEEPILQALEKNKSKNKAFYEIALKEYQLLKEQLEKIKLRLQKTSEKEKVLACENEIETLQVRLFEKKGEIEQSKSELIGIEREIFVVKKQQREQVSVS